MHGRSERFFVFTGQATPCASRSNRGFGSRAVLAVAAILVLAVETDLEL